VSVLNWSDKVEIWDLLKGSVSLVGVGQHCGKNESRIHRRTLNSMYPKHSHFSLLVASLEPYTCGYQGTTFCLSVYVSIYLPIIYLFTYLYICSVGIWTQDFVLARQALYTWAILLAFRPGQPWTMILLPATPAYFKLY
jgi:hypothetical protein